MAKCNRMLPVISAILYTLYDRFVVLTVKDENNKISDIIEETKRVMKNDLFVEEFDNNCCQDPMSIISSIFF